MLLAAHLAVALYRAGLKDPIAIEIIYIAPTGTWV